MDRGILWLATGFGLGRSPILPGTIGCLMGLPLGWGLMQINSIGIQMLMAALLVLISIPLCDRAEKLIGGKDPQSIVADEYLTLPICVIGFSSPLYLFSGFVFHRIFDITKPLRLEMYRVYLAVGVWWLTIYWLRYLLGAVMPFWRMELVCSIFD